MNFDSIYPLTDDLTQTILRDINPIDTSEASDSNQSQIEISGSIDKSIILNELKKLKKRFQHSEEGNKKIFKSLTQKIKILKNELSEFNENSTKFLKFNLPTLPFTSHLQYLDYEKKLAKDYESKANLRYFIKTLNANDYSSFIKKAIKTFIPDELAIHFSWRGTSKKPSVQTFVLIAIIRDITLSKYIEATEKQINRIIQQHFIHANDRLKKKQKTVK